jgi:hypothetical protein
MIKAIVEFNTIGTTSVGPCEENSVGRFKETNQ